MSTSPRCRSIEDLVVQNLGQRLAQLRRERGLSQQGLADIVRPTPQWISQVERGKRSVTVHPLVKLATGLTVPLVALFDPPDHDR